MRAGATVSTSACRPLIVTATLLAPANPVAKIVTRNAPFEGSNGPRNNVSELSATASPRPSPDTVNMPGAVGEIVASAIDDSPSAFVTTNCAGPFANPVGTTNTTSSGDT